MNSKIRTCIWFILCSIKGFFLFKNETTIFLAIIILSIPVNTLLLLQKFNLLICMLSYKCFMWKVCLCGLLFRISDTIILAVKNPSNKERPFLAISLWNKVLNNFSVLFYC
jgi:hypothetical protein